MKRFRIPVLFTLFAALVLSASGQSVDLPVLHARDIREIGVEDGLSTGCFNQMLLDSKGRMWLNTCGDAQRNRSIHLLQFDGYEGDFHDLGLSLGESVVLGGFIHDSILAGIVTDSSKLFFYHIPSQKIEFFSPPEKSLRFYNLQVADNNIYVLARTQKEVMMLEFADKKFVRQIAIHGMQMPDAEAIEYGIGIVRQMVMIGQDIWLTDESAHAYRYNIPTQKVDVFTSPDDKLLAGANVLNWDGHLVIGYGQTNNLDVLAFDGTSLVPLEVLPSGWTYSKAYSGARFTHFLFADDSRWLFVNCRDERGNIHQLLTDWEGKKYEYTEVISRLPHNAFENLKGYDFTRDVHTLSGALVMAEIDRDNGIDPYPSLPGRAMVQVNKDKVLCLTDRVPVMLDLAQKAFSTVSGYEKVNPNERMQIQQDDQGRLWYVDADKLYRYTPGTEQLQQWPMPMRFEAFVLFRDQVLLLSRGLMFQFDPMTENFLQRPFKGNEKIEGKLNQLVLLDDFLWVATSKGLWKIGLSADGLSHIPLGDRLDMALLALCADANGILWLGTESFGVVRFDPKNGQVRFCDRRQGLSHNTVVGILDDNAGYKWISTFGGVNVINDTMEIVARFTKAQGLVSNEGNRWSNLRLSDGTLIFGTVEGFSVIDPKKALKEFQSPVPVHIYCKTAEYTLPGPSSHKVSLMNTDFSLTPIPLSATNRSIRLHLGTTDYISSQATEYVYKINRPGYEWVSVGNQPSLVITNLPPGNYDILIRALSAKGIWSSNIESIHVSVAKPFYNRWWFYVLCTLPFLGYFLLWFWRSRLERIHLEEEVRKRTMKIEAQAKELKQMDEAKTRIYTNITHEFRTPLTVIKGIAEVIEGSEEKKRMMGRNIDRLLNLVNQLLELSKLESGHLELKMAQHDIVSLVRDIFESFTPIAQAKDVGMHFYARPPRITMDCDVEVVYRIVGNLLSNALKFTPSGGNIYVEVLASGKDEKEEKVQITVRDTGIGIPADKIDHIFNRFYQVDDTTTRAGEGTGIGLALTRELVEYLKGTITVDSIPGEGSTFMIVLPVTTLAPLSSVEDGYDEVNIIASSLDSHQATAEILVDHESEMPSVLVVEDNPDVIHYLMNCLQSTYQVLIAMDGQEGVHKAIQLVPDLIISDVMMPVKDGIRLCDEIKHDEHTSHIPVMLLSAKADIASRIEGLKFGADAYLAKPFERDELKLIVRNLIETRKSLRSRYLSETPLQTTDQPADTEDAFMIRVNELVDAHLDDEDYGVMALSIALKYHRSQVHNKVKALTGMSTSGYIQHRRLLHAKKLMQAGQLTISEVAYAVGFRDPNYFSRVFKKEFGLSPTSFLHPADENKFDT